MDAETLLAGGLLILIVSADFDNKIGLVVGFILIVMAAAIEDGEI